jgi:hypothetical protein
MGIYISGENESVIFRDFIENLVRIEGFPT